LFFRGAVPEGQAYGRMVLMIFLMSSSATCPETFRSAKTVKKTGPDGAAGTALRALGADARAVR
jgi:hypothetical protein